MKKSSRSRKQKLSAEFLKKLKSVTAKRARTVIDHILKHGFITTEELGTTYGYDHPPRAVRDVREHGIPIETFRAIAQNGRSIAAYRFGDPSQVRAGRNAGRTAWPKQFKEQLAETGGHHCAICLAESELRYLQIDHRVPFEVAGEPVGIQQSSDFMLVCGSCNRAKSWSCEHCPNWRETHDESVCRSCYWASPDDYTHVALRLVRRLDVTWTESEVRHYEHLRELAAHAEQTMPEFVKDALRSSFPEQ